MSDIRWVRVVLTAFLLEVAITALVLPFGFAFGDPIRSAASGPPGRYAPYFVSAAVGCAGLGFLFGRWAARAAGARHALHGLLVGVSATLIYFGLGTLAPGGLAGVIAAYSPGIYALLNVLRIAGCWAGGASVRSS